MGVLAKSPFGETPFRPPPTFLIAFWRTTRDLTFGFDCGTAPVGGLRIGHVSHWWLSSQKPCVRCSPFPAN